ncbi:hypothetical protein CD122_00470 [Staphylococcus rostri]|uniref:Peptidase M50 domain-containing protein n=1 Tax=Staphylococcus rostri TaxID=522262 RepID=A0A2K3YY20_9STAP|nr:M50 family metallopeptidase [Staphylococcus rostri]PNZ30502.1 hypothetical protein CD122_00470 [Staphylococcus rostri]
MKAMARKLYALLDNILILEICLFIMTAISYVYHYEIIFNISLLIIAGVISIVVHELGHYFWGVLFKFKLFMLSLVSVLILKGHIYVNHPVFLGLGMTNMYVEDWEKPVKVNQLVAYCSGGFMFNFLCAGILFCITNFTTNTTFLYDVILMNMIVGMMTMLPFIKGNDGHHIYQLVTKGSDSQYYNDFRANSMYHSDKINIKDYEEQVFHNTTAFQWNVIYLYEKLNNHALKYSLKANYDNNYEDKIIAFYVFGLEGNSDFELEDIMLIYGKCLFYVRKYIETQNDKYLYLAHKHKRISLDFRQAYIIDQILARYSEVDR